MKTIPLYGKIAAGRLAMVDDADYDLVTTHRWNVYERKRPSGSISGPYAFTGTRRDGRQTTLWMHKLLMPGIAEVDHHDGNGLNNQRSNLRDATRRQNHANQRKRPGCSSQFKGVCWDKNAGKWHAQIRHTKGHNQYLGLFADEEAAARAYDAAARESFGEFARLNFPVTDGR